MARTRATKPSAKAAQEKESVQAELKSLPPPDTNPSKLFILPSNASKDARIVTLPDPINNRPNRYYACPQNGIYEFTRISAPRPDPRSWLLVSNQSISGGLKETHEVEETSSNQGYVSQSQDLFVATPIDALFFLVPLLSPSSTSNESKKLLFIPLDDHIDNAQHLTSQMKYLLRNAATKHIFEKRMRTICDVVEAGDDSMFRISHTKLASVILEKALRIVAQGLPGSMEERFVTRALQAPVSIIKREDSAFTNTTILNDDDTPETQSMSTNSQTVVGSTTSSFSKASTAVEAVIQSGASDDIRNALRIRTALDFILRSYVPNHLHETTEAELVKAKSVDFTPLTEYLSHLERLRSEATALRTISENISRKRVLQDDDEAADMRAEKKRKKEDEERKKKSGTRALKDLRKVDTSSMKKLSSFFTKGPKKEAKT